MTVFECERLAQEYAEWLRQNLKTQVQGEVCVIASPFVDHHRDFLQIAIRSTDSGLLLTDDGYVIRDLQISGLEIETERRQQALHEILRSFGITLDGQELQILTPREEFPQAKHNLIQAMLAVGDLIHLAQPTVIAVFKEDVERYLRIREVSFVTDVKLTGSSGFDHSFDFVVGESRRRPERYLRAISSPTRERIVEMMFAWQDLRDARPRNSLAYAILNDQERSVSRPLLDALDKYQIGVIPWSDREAQTAGLQG